MIEAELTREDLAVEADRSSKASVVLEVLSQLILIRGAPRQNGYEESFNSRFRDEFLGQEVFADVKEAEFLSEWWKNDYNHRRLHSPLEYLTPAHSPPEPAT